MLAHAQPLAAETVAAARRARTRARRGGARAEDVPGVRQLGDGRLRACAPPTRGARRAPADRRRVARRHAGARGASARARRARSRPAPRCPTAPTRWFASRTRAGRAARSSCSVAVAAGPRRPPRRRRRPRRLAGARGRACGSARPSSACSPRSGRASVLVGPRPRVALVTTGDELVGVDERAAAGRRAQLGLLRDPGAGRAGRRRDGLGRARPRRSRRSSGTRSPPRSRRRRRRSSPAACRSARHDHVGAALAELGVERRLRRRGAAARQADLVRHAAARRSCSGCRATRSPR